MAKLDREQWLVQRRVTTGDVIVVQPMRRRHPELGVGPSVEPRVERKAVAPADSGLEAGAEAEGAEESYRWWEEHEAEGVPPAVERTADTVVEESDQPWPYTPAPEGYAYEFGTGRLIKVAE